MSRDYCTRTDFCIIVLLVLLNSDSRAFENELFKGGFGLPVSLPLKVLVVDDVLSNCRRLGRMQAILVI